jgi:multidrug efflux system outer membrane protein
LLLGACASVTNAPDAQATAQVPAAWPSASGTSNTSGSSAPASNASAPLPAWSDYFADPALRELIRIAIAQNRDLRVSLLNIEQARAQLGLRRADALPTVNLSANGSRTPSTTGSISSSYTAGLLASSYELDFWGRVSSLSQQALAQYLATQEGARTAQISLIATVAQSWLSLLADEELLALSQQTLASREAGLRLNQLRFDHGAASELELRLAQSLTEAARVTLAQQQRQRAQDENALALLLGQPLPAALRSQLTTARLTQLRLPELPLALPSEVLTQRPDIRQAEQQLLAANANIGAARAAFFPRITLTAGVGSASGALENLFKSGFWGYTLAPQLLLPIFDGGRNQAGLDAAQAGRDIALAQYDKAIQNAFREVADALAGRDTLGEQLRAQTAQAEAEAVRQRLTELRYSNGAASLLDSLDAQRSLFAAQQAVVQARLAYWSNQIALYKTLGGGAPAPMH